MAKISRKDVRRVAIAVPALAVAIYFVPFVALFFVATGLVDVLRNEVRNRTLFERYFTGNGVTNWLLSPVNLFFDLLCYRNRKIYRLEDFPPEYRAEIEDAIDAFKTRKDDIIADIDRAFDSGRRGMYVYRWYGRRYNRSVEEFNRPFRYLQTIAVSVFTGRESTSWHFGPLRLSLRVLYNLTPVDSDDVYIECGRTRHVWRDDPLFIFDDTLMHRSVNEYEARRYCVFMDILRPSPVPAVLSALRVALATISQGFKGIFYRNWKMLDAQAADGAATTKPRSIHQRSQT
jgi:beta-hydroxylase